MLVNDGRLNVLIVLLEYIDLLPFELQHKRNIWEGRPSFILLFSILSLPIVANVYFAQICSYYASIFLFAFHPSIKNNVL